MKKIGLILIVLVAIICFYTLKRISANYNEALSVLDHKANASLDFYGYYNQLKVESGEFPSEHNRAIFIKLHPYLSESDSLINIYADKLFFDNLSRSESDLVYVPIYVNNKKLGYACISAGIDGKLNNDFGKINHLDRLSFKNLKLYEKNTFNFIDYFFGDKDLVIYKFISE